MFKSLYKYGVEIECISPLDNLQPFANCVHRVGVQTASDGSIRYASGTQALELRTPPLSLEKTIIVLKEIESLCRKYDVIVNDSCGLHVHTSNSKFLNNVNLRKILGLWVAMEDVFFATQPESRLNSNYCKRRLASYAVAGFPKLPKEKQQMVNSLGESDRYFALNFASLRRHGTLECRLHAGTTNSEKIINWIKLLTAFYDYALYSYNPVEVNKLFLMATSEEKIERAWDLIKLDPDLRSHFNERIEKFLFPRLAQQQQQAKEMISYRLKTNKEEATLNEKIKKGYEIREGAIKKADKIIHDAENEREEISRTKVDQMRDFLKDTPELNLERMLSPWGGYGGVTEFLVGENESTEIQNITPRNIKSSPKKRYADPLDIRPMGYLVNATSIPDTFYSSRVINVGVTQQQIRQEVARATTTLGEDLI